jgi:intracellular sulfur oxidation DsrE/DsrF family protein
LVRSEQSDSSTRDSRLDRRTILKVASGAAVAGGVALSAHSAQAALLPPAVPNNFRAVVHVTNEDGLQYAYAALETITEHYKKAKGRLVVDGSAVKILATDEGLANVTAAHDAGAEIAAANDALAINGIDPESLPDFIDASNPGVIAVVDAQVKGYHYYKL